MIKSYKQYAFLKNTTILVISFWVSSLYAQSLSTPALANGVVESGEIADREAVAKDLRDPTLPLHQQAIVNTEYGLSLTAIAKIGNRPFAIISGRRVFEGGVIGDAVIVKINAGNVVYRKNSVLHTLKMRYSVID